MAATNLTSGNSASVGTGFSTSSISPNSNTLLLASFSVRNGSSTPPGVPTVTGNGLTWELVNSINYDTAGTSRRTLFIFRAMGASPSSGAVTCTTAESDTDFAWSIDEITGVDTSGTNGSGAIVQSAVNSDETGTLATLVVTLSAFSNIQNTTYGAFATDGNTTWTPGSGFTELSEESSGITLGLTTEWKNSNDTSVDATMSVASAIGGIAIEIKAYVPPAGTITGLSSVTGISTMVI